MGSGANCFRAGRSPPFIPHPRPADVGRERGMKQIFEIPFTQESPVTGAAYLRALTELSDLLDLQENSNVRCESLEIALGIASSKTGTVPTSLVDRFADIAVNEAYRKGLIVPAMTLQRRRRAHENATEKERAARERRSGE